MIVGNPEIVFITLSFLGVIIFAIYIIRGRKPSFAGPPSTVQGPDLQKLLDKLDQQEKRNEALEDRIKDLAVAVKLRPQNKPRKPRGKR